MQFVFTPERVCSKMFMIEVDDATRTIKNFEFKGGCPGNLAPRPRSPPARSSSARLFLSFATDWIRAWLRKGLTLGWTPSQP